MGSITSRGADWPPKPYRRRVVRDEVRNIDGKKVTVSVEDYVWVYPGAEIPNGCGGADFKWYGEDASQFQENAVRHLEDG
jgi:hypothetical protein